MAKPTLTPASTTSAITLSVTGSTSEVTSSLPFGTYVSTDYYSTSEVNLFISGAADQVGYVFKKMGGDVLDIEITDSQVYASYEEACLEYSYIVNMHQSQNILSNVLGATTGTFDHDGQIQETTGNIKAGTNLNTKYPKFDFAYAQSAIYVLAIQQLYGEQALYHIMQNINNGQSFKDAFYNSTLQTLEQFNELLYPHIKNKYWWFRLITLPNQIFSFLPLLLVIGFIMQSRKNKKIRKQWELEEELECLED